MRYNRGPKPLRLQKNLQPPVPQHHQSNNCSGGSSGGHGGVSGGGSNSHRNNHSNSSGKNEPERKCSGSQFSRGISWTHSTQRQQSSQPGSSRSQSLAPKGNNTQFNNNKRDWKGSKTTYPQKEKSAPCLSDKEKSD